MGKKYIVQKDASFASGGRVYGPGDELDGDIFKNPDSLKAALGGTKPKLKPKEKSASPSGDNAEIIKGLKKSLKAAEKDADAAADFLDKAQGEVDTATELVNAASELEKPAAEETLAAAVKKQEDAQASKEKFDGVVKSIRDKLAEYGIDGATD
jgi:hypothetical protein